MPKAISLLSGGLDSTLATVVIQRLGVEVTAVSFMMPFGCDASDRSSCSRNALPAAKQFGFQLKLCPLGDAFLDIVRNPKHGHGKNLNPCIDCRILMLREARKLMEMTSSDFLVTGEVVGQRPMSQKKNTLRMIEKEAGVKDLVLRPLTAANLPPTLPETSGLVDRSKLYGFSGRTRKPQMALAAELGLTEYPAPAGGCLLTDPLYSAALRTLLTRRPNIDYYDIQLLRAGRQFWTEGGAWIVVGRNRLDNEILQTLKKPGDILLHVPGVGSPLALLRYSTSETDLLLAGGICARYTRKQHDPAVTVLTDQEIPLEVRPLGPEDLDRLRPVHV